MAPLFEQGGLPTETADVSEDYGYSSRLSQWNYSVLITDHSLEQPGGLLLAQVRRRQQAGLRLGQRDEPRQIVGPRL